MKPSKYLFVCIVVFLSHILADQHHVYSTLFMWGFLFVFFVCSFSARKRCWAWWKWSVSSGPCGGSRFRFDILLYPWRRSAHKKYDLWIKILYNDPTEPSKPCHQSAKCQRFKYQRNECSVQTRKWIRRKCRVCRMYVSCLLTLGKSKSFWSARKKILLFFSLLGKKSFEVELGIVLVWFHCGKAGSWSHQVWKDEKVPM